MMYLRPLHWPPAITACHMNKDPYWQRISQKGNNMKSLNVQPALVAVLIVLLAALASLVIVKVGPYPVPPAPIEVCNVAGVWL